MKKLFLIVLCLLMLCGCSADKPAKTPPETTPEVTEPQYLPQGALAQGKELRSYSLSEPVVKLLPMGQNLLAVTFAEDGSLRLTLLSGSQGAVLSQRTLEPGVSVDACFRANGSGVGYYCSLENTVVILDDQLHEASRIQLPQENQGCPVLAEDFSKVYYCNADQIRIFELRTGVSRLLKQHSCDAQSLIALANRESLLVCSVVGDGRAYTALVATEDGRTLGEYTNHLSFEDAGEHYYISRQDGIVTEYLFGDYSGEIQSFTLAQKGRDFAYVAGNHTMVVSEKGSSGIVLDGYTLSNGKRASRIELPGATAAHSFAGYGKSVWFVAQVGQAQSLCCWDLEASGVEDSTVYTTVRYTAQAPDQQGLAQLQARADALQQRWGVKIVVNAQDVSQSEDYTITTEHQIAALDAGLSVLETALPRFPEDFFTRIVEDTGNKMLTISLVREISDDKQSLQYWVGADAHIALVVGENVEQNFYHELCHVLDAFIYANSRDLDVWDTLNPEGFTYDYSYELYQSHGTEYLEGKNQAFVDAFSRTYPKEDRARVWEYALMPDMEATFDSEIMQSKLYLLSFSIRDAFNWKKDSRAFPWEYYLEEPLAYVKKK